MIRPYIGTSNPGGLESLRPEYESTARASAERAYRTRPRHAFCWWTALSDGTAAEVLGHIERGDRQAALATIDDAAVHLGPIMPGKYF